MRFGKELNQALKIILVFAVITSVFKLIDRLSTFIVAINRNGFKNFIEVYLIWFIAMILIIVSIFMYLKKTEGDFNLTFIHNPMIRLTSGLLIIFIGIFNLSISVPAALAGIKAIYQFTSGSEYTGTSRETFLISNAIPSLLNLLQVLLGLYFVLHNKCNKEIKHLD